ncbi:hypothetical protein J437_LFUL008185 [Ladona fulva]|uniref:Uncharacterized protein n=1 Tax=Ladona fulva TaxID=123851 RepID=A0A8K0K7H4_LADFU|nr:hypothetical protein J437_LFUL008185 [Ladona fulva]
MGKKGHLQGKEAFLRMNFLYQAAKTVLLNSPNSDNIVSHYGRCMVKIGKKAVLRIDRDLKRTICKGCGNVLVTGVNSTVRQRKKKGRRRIVVTCLLCRTVKRFPKNKVPMKLRGQK